MNESSLPTTSSNAAAATGSDDGNLLQHLGDLLRKAGFSDFASLARRSAFDSGPESVGLDHVETEEINALQKLQSGEFDQITDAERMQLQAIVQRQVFPVPCVINGTFENLPPPWQQLNDNPIRARIEAAIPSVGRIERLAGDGSRAQLGTGFLVGDRLVMTNRNIAEFFVHGSHLNAFEFDLRVPGFVDLKREKDMPAGDDSRTVRIKGIRMRHPYWDIALLELEDMPAGMLPLLLSIVAPEDLNAGHEIIKIGFPALSNKRGWLNVKGAELEAQVLGGEGGVKRIAPGMLKNNRRKSVPSYGHPVSVLHYETSVMASLGTGGAPLLDLTGNVIGIGFASDHAFGSYAVPACELARDRRVLDAGVVFAGSVPLSDEWESHWKEQEKKKESFRKQQQQKVQAVPPPASRTFVPS